MARGRRATPEELLGSLEAVIMRDLWKHGLSRVGDVVERLNRRRNRPLAYNTVMSVMARLSQEKHLLVRERAGRAFLYKPVVSQDEFLELQATRAAQGMVADFGTAAVAGFVQTVSSDESLRAELERLLKETDGRGKGKAAG